MTCVAQISTSAESFCIARIDVYKRQIQGILLMLVLFATIYFERRSVASKIHHAVNAANA